MVKSGYRLTEVGAIPKDWNVCKFSDLGENFVGLTYKPSDVKEYGTLVLRSSNVQGGRLAFDNNVFVEMELPSRVIVEEEDILICVRNGSRQLIGKCALIDSETAGSAFGAFMSVFRTNLSKYVFFQFQSKHLQRQIEENMGATINQITNKDMAAFVLPLPHNPLERDRIANALSDIDALIVSLEKLIAKKRDIKTGTMQQLLNGKRRLPGFGEGKGYKESELGEIPEDWDAVNLGDIGNTIIGLTYSPRDVAENGTLVLRSSNIQKGVLAFDNNVFVNMDVPKRVIVAEGDLLICVRNGSRNLIGKCALIDENTAGSAFGAFMSVFRSPDSRFAFCQFQSDTVQKQINETMGATINQITNKDMASIKIQFPRENTEREAIFHMLLDIDIDLANLVGKLSKMRQVKQGMMQELLTGRTRLVDSSQIEAERLHGT